jgi:hypothetical protein
MTNLDTEMSEKYPGLFKGLSKMTPLELSRVRKPTFTENSSIFRKNFKVDTNRNIVKIGPKTEKEADEEVTENFFLRIMHQGII